MTTANNIADDRSLSLGNNIFASKLLSAGVLEALDEATLWSLSTELTLDSPNMFECRDWRGLAGEVGMSGKMIRLIEQHSEQLKGKMLLEVWHSTGRSSVGKLYLALMTLELVSCLNILRESPALKG